MIPAVERIVLPWFEGEGVSERDLRSLSYASRRALPTLKSVEDAFKKSLEEQVRSDAEREVGFIGGLVNATFEHEYVLGEHRFFSRVERGRTGPTPKTLLSGITLYIERCRNDPLSRLGRKIIVEDDERYVDPNAIVTRRTRLDAHASTDTKTSIDHGWASGEPFALDDRIEMLDLVPAPNAHRRLTEANAQTHYLVKSLSKLIDGFVKQAKTRIRHTYGVSSTPGEPVYVPLSDRSVYRLLPLEKPSVSYASILAGVLGPRTPNGTITKTTGDLVIAAELGFDADYERAGASGVRVTHEPHDDRTRTLRITRPDSTRSYRMLEHGERTFVRVEDIVDAMSALTSVHTKRADDTKHEFLPPIPAYLQDA